MSAIACLRVAIEPGAVSLPEEALGPLVEKLTSAYLEARWSWPREFAPLTHYAFLLTDPRADELDIRELVKLSEELQLKFFGQSNSGKVALLLFEGSEEAARDFAKLDADALTLARSDPSWLPPGGRLAQILAEDVVTHATGPDASALAGGEAADGIAARARLYGIYFRLRDVFIGDVVTQFDQGMRERATIMEGRERLPRDPERFDAATIEAALHLLRDDRLKSILYLPFCYDSLVRPSSRASLSARISELPESRRAQMAAIVYNVPRDPPFGAVNQIRATLGTRFTSIDLRVDDPDFEVEKLPVQAVAGVSFALPSGDRRARMAALRHFTQHRHAYKQRRIWASVTNVRDLEELQACEALGVPFVTGPAICEPQIRPLAGRIATMDQLPVRASGGLARAALSA